MSLDAPYFFKFIFRQSCRSLKYSKMSFWSKLFTNKAVIGPSVRHAVDADSNYLGYIINPTPIKNGGQYQTCGVISKNISGELKEYRFIRVDRFSSLDDARQMIIIKARQIIDERGDNLFTDQSL